MLRGVERGGSTLVLERDQGWDGLGGSRWTLIVAPPFASVEKDQPIEVDQASPTIDFLGRSTEIERPTLDPVVYVETVCGLLGIDMEVVCSRVRDRGTAYARKTIVTLGVERWRQSRVGLARVLQKNPDMVSWWAGEGAKLRTSDPSFAAELDRLDESLASRAAAMTTGERLGQTF